MSGKKVDIESNKEIILSLRKQGVPSKKIAEILEISQPTILARLSCWLYESIDDLIKEKVKDYLMGDIDIDYISKVLDLDRLVVSYIKKNLGIKRKTLEHTDKRFYVYVHKNSSGEIVYVGSGSGKRYKALTQRSERHLKEFKNLDKEIVKYGLTKAESLKEEQILLSTLDIIKLFNTKEIVGVEIDLDYDVLNSHFYYDESSPSCLKWKSGNCLERKSRVAYGTNAGHLNPKGYWVVSLYRKTLRVHRIIYCLKHGNFDKHLVVDHIDRDSTNNKVDNLRLVSSSANGKNKTLSKRNSTGFTGVCRQSENEDLYYSVSWSENGSPKSLRISPRIIFPEETKEFADKSAFELAVFTRKLVEYMFYDKEFEWPIP